jgi:hypothetical protein
MAEQSAVSGLVNRSAFAGASDGRLLGSGDGRLASGDDRLPDQRSQVTNGKRLFIRGSQGDGNGAWARRMRDVIALHVSDLGGWNNVTEAEKSILRRAATLTVELERLEARFSNSDHSPRDSDLQTYQRLTNTLRRALEAVGIHRRPRDVTPPTLDSYLDALSRSKAEQNSEIHSSGAQTNGRE